MKLKNIILVILLLSSTLLANQEAMKSVVKIFSSVSKPNYQAPWQSKNSYNYTGSGVIIDGNKILTSAHVVSNAVFIEVKKEDDYKKYIAKVKYISHQADLALLELEDNSFFKNTKSLKLNDDVKLRDEVIVLGYPKGGNTISTTTGVISRIENTRYSFSGKYLLSIQIDAAINSGNSGGPAINKNGELIGIAMQKIKSSSNIAYITPAIIIKTFLEDTKDGKIDGFEVSRNYYAPIENKSMKKYYGIKDKYGIIITKISNKEKLIKVDDIILAVDGHKIENNGEISSKYGKVDFNLILNQKQIGDKVTYKILRDKKIIDLQYEIKNNKGLIQTEFEKDPQYMIYGGFVFIPLTYNYLGYGMYKAIKGKIDVFKKEGPDKPKQIVFLMNRGFKHRVNRGYFFTRNIVKKVNGVLINNFKQFVNLLDNNKNEYTIIELLDNGKIILNTKEAKRSFQDIRRRYNLRVDRNIRN